MPTPSSPRAGPVPRVGIVVPFYGDGASLPRRLEFLDECLGSLRRQSLGGWEAVVVDDGSPDPAAVRRVVERPADDRIRYVRHDANLGLGAARNTGARSSQAALLLPVDADDRLNPVFLEATCRVLDERLEIDCVFTAFQVFGEAERIVAHSVRPWPEILRRQWIPGPGALMRRRVWEVAGGYAEDRTLLGNEDWDFWIAALSRGVQPSQLGDALYEYRQWSGSLTFRYPPQDGHPARRAIYRRHRGTFRANRSGPQFLAGGFVNSAVASWRDGRRGLAVVWATCALAISPRTAGDWLPRAVRGAGACLTSRTRRGSPR
jgi:glycosyltransferase involved in cell wall biosynthesis